MSARPNELWYCYDRISDFESVFERPMPDHDRYVRAELIAPLIDAAAEFVRRVEAGEVRSKRSYEAFRQALSALPPSR